MIIAKKSHYISQLAGGLLIKNTHSSIIKKIKWHDFYTETPNASHFESYSWLCKNCFIAVFTVSRLLTDFVCLYNYEFLLSLCKIARSSVILLLPLFHIVWLQRNFFFSPVPSFKHWYGRVLLNWSVISVNIYYAYTHLK